jgi:hypothetical protein
MSTLLRPWAPLHHLAPAASSARPPRARCHRCGAAADPDRLSTKLAADLSPLDAVALPGRIAIGALSGLGDAAAVVSAAERFLGAKPDTLLDTLDRELAILDARGSQALAGLLSGAAPGAQAAGDSEPVTATRSSRATVSAGPPQVQARFQGGVANNRAGSEVEALLRELRAAREALNAAAAPGAGSLKLLAASTATQRLQRHLRELDAEGGDWLNAVGSADDAAALRDVLGQLRALSDELAGKP